MHNWVKFVVRTTVVGGGLLMVGPGIASATENVDLGLPTSLADQQVVTPAVVVLDDSLRKAQPLRQLETGGRRALQPVADTVGGAPGAELQAPSLPLSGTVVTDPLDPGAGTRVTAVHAAAPDLGNTDTPRSADPTPVVPVVGAVPVAGTLPDEAPAVLTAVEKLIGSPETSVRK
ncbi:hypothetical protein ACIQUM_21125 [Amycolatopsis azurea]|uniref:hypothetical protein n=1 Tax=Amycolatopsis azurea TaxID=36819 RepID=UPI0038254A51